ncbi:hypothetical protein ONE63_007181 [Megalurothrips usitatus]|uniref:Sodium/potassium/calcium exchanger 5 n=1 Tax=Megalurothrips usitatus TaxID=439358 RepID=A0AAV7XYQ7_9NEOP|nr:hypothetical protein ONE63_007181 [Megalurothrips usitatus]
MVELTLDGGPLRTTPTAQAVGEVRAGGPSGGLSRQVRRGSARRVLTRLAIFVGIPAAYVAVAALGHSLGLAGAPAAASDSVPGAGAGLGRHLLWADGENCTPPAILEFPPDLFTRAQRQKGAAVLHGVLACYLFVLFAVVCDDYFVPSIKKLCSNLHMSEDVAGATFMAAATSSPELFINLVGTFVTEGDIGVGAVVGSAVFNILAVPACCGIFAGAAVTLDWWPVTRDCTAYGITVVLLILTLRDGRVEWYEALLLVCVYLLYLLIMCYNTKMSRKAKALWRRARQGKSRPVGERSPLLGSGGGDPAHPHGEDPEEGKQAFADEDDISELSLSAWPKDCGRWERAWWLLTWPISVLLFLTVPDCRQERWKKWYPLTFVSCIVWIALTSYMVAWMITAIGDTLQIPDSVMGLTFLAAGMSVPEAVSSVIVTKQGHGAMGISNSLGSNVFDILLCLGLPWLIKAAFFPVVPSDHGVIINSQGLAYSSISLLSTLVGLYATFVCSRFRLDWRVGVTCLVLYAAYLVLASLIELNVFFVVNLPTCPADI